MLMLFLPLVGPWGTGNTCASRKSTPLAHHTNHVNQNLPTHPLRPNPLETAAHGHTYPPTFHSPKKRTQPRLRRARRHPHRRTTSLPRFRSGRRCMDHLRLLWIHNDRLHAKTTTVVTLSSTSCSKVRAWRIAHGTAHGAAHSRPPEDAHGACQKARSMDGLLLPKCLPQAQRCRWGSYRYARNDIVWIRAWCILAGTVEVSSRRSKGVTLERKIAREGLVLYEREQ